MRIRIEVVGQAVEQEFVFCQVLQGIYLAFIVVFEMNQLDTQVADSAIICIRLFAVVDDVPAQSVYILDEEEIGYSLQAFTDVPL